MTRNIYFPLYTKYLGKPLYKFARKKLHLPKALAMAAAHTPCALVHGAIVFAGTHLAGHLIGNPPAEYAQEYKDTIMSLSIGLGIGTTLLSYAVIVPLQLALHGSNRNQRNHPKSIEDQL